MVIELLLYCLGAANRPGDGNHKWRFAISDPVFLDRCRYLVFDYVPQMRTYSTTLLPTDLSDLARLIFVIVRDF